MKLWRTWVPYALAAVVVTGGLIALSRDNRVNEESSIESTGGHGVKTLFRYLQARGYDVRAIQDAPRLLPAEVRTLVVVAPDEREVTTETIADWERFLRRGGTLVYLAPLPIGSTQEEAARWLELKSLAPPEPLPGQSFQTWPVLPFVGAPSEGVLATKAKTPVLQVGGAFVPVAGDVTIGSPLVQRVFENRGRLFVGAGPDLASNDAITEGDNIEFWERLAQDGPLGFDEHHHRAAPPPLPRSLVLVAIHSLLLFALYAWVRGVRMGAPRSIVVQKHRSSREYLEAFAGLLRTSAVEKDLLGESWERLRRTLHDELGVPLKAEDTVFADELAAARRIPRERFLTLAAEVHAALREERVRPRRYIALMRGVAALDRDVGHGAAPTVHERA